MDEIVKKLDYLRANTPDVSLDNTLLQNSRVIAWKNNERLVNQQLKGCIHYLNRYATSPMYILYQLNEKNELIITYQCLLLPLPLPFLKKALASNSCPFRKPCCVYKI